MVHEFLRSLEGFQDELTGLLSKQIFRGRYDTVFGRNRKAATVTAVLFSVEFDRLADTFGHKAAVEVLRALGEYINAHLGAPGGFSTRQGRDQILTMLPHVDLDEARDLVKNLGKALQERVLHKIQRSARSRAGLEACFEIHVSAGIIEARSNDAVETIIKRARDVQEMIAVHMCS
jgi:phospholipid/cholesterol/gamma-HCH transport system ATP-binding protein